MRPRARSRQKRRPSRCAARGSCWPSAGAATLLLQAPAELEGDAGETKTCCAPAPPIHPQAALGAEVLYSAAALARLLLAATKAAPPEALQQAAELLHDHALLAAGAFQGLQDEVARLCLDWWQAEAPGRERLTPQTVPFLLVKALASGARGAGPLPA